MSGYQCPGGLCRVLLLFILTVVPHPTKSPVDSLTLLTSLVADIGIMVYRKTLK
jgi:hypothetical protein